MEIDRAFRSTGDQLTDFVAMALPLFEQRQDQQLGAAAPPVRVPRLFAAIFCLQTISGRSDSCKVPLHPTSTLRDLRTVDTQRVVRGCCLAAALVTLLAGLAQAQSSLSGAVFHITRANAAIRVDGDSAPDEAWRTRDAHRQAWYEVTPGDKHRAAGQERRLPDLRRSLLLCRPSSSRTWIPRRSRAPLGDHDDISGNSMDFGGIFIDPLNTGRTAFEFFVTPRNVSTTRSPTTRPARTRRPISSGIRRARITDHGWIVEMRIPFSIAALQERRSADVGHHAVSQLPAAISPSAACRAPIPRGSNCLDLPREPSRRASSGSAGRRSPRRSAVCERRAATARPPVTRCGQPLVADAAQAAHRRRRRSSTPTPNNAIDVTIKPDFSQVESDTAQISANERFALFFPRSVRSSSRASICLQTPIQAVYTRTITAPTWGGRVTGKDGGDSLHGARDRRRRRRQRRSCLVPMNRPTAPQDFASTVFVGRAQARHRPVVCRRTGDRSGSRQRRRRTTGVAGPRLPVAAVGRRMSITGQWLFSETPERRTGPDLASEWNGQRPERQRLPDHLESQHAAPRLVRQKYTDVGGGFRADTGFVPQVGLSARRMAQPDGPCIRRGSCRCARPFVTRGLSGGTDPGRSSRADVETRRRPEHAMERLHAVPL